MYGKVFSSIYDGTLYGNWEAIATFQQLIVLANADGVVDMTPQAIAARTSFPLDLLLRGIKFLESPDPYSRTPGDDGKRIVLIDAENRPWGWQIVNHGKYQRLRNMEQKREADRARINEKRNKNNDVATTSQMSPTQYADADVNADEKSNTPASSAKALSAGGNGSGIAYIPLNDGSEYSVSQVLAAELSKLYPAVDVPQTLNEIRAWNLANPQRRKTKRGVVQHINSWLSKEQNRGPQRA